MNKFNNQRKNMNKFILTLLSILTFTVNAQTVSGAGATFPAPLYAKWADAYNKETGVKINYQSVGSGAGIRQVESRTITFGASDMPLTDEKLTQLQVTQWPMAIGGVVPVINLKDIKPGELKLTGTVLADIFLGKIKKWNDTAIKTLNPTLALPDQDIAPVRRADGSGTTFIWTNYLSKVSKEFKDTVGEGTTVNWKVGIGGRGNEGVAAMVRQVAGSLGYVEYAYVKQTNMNWVQVQNRDKQWVKPEDDSFKAAAIGAKWNETFYQILTDQQGKNAWPITGATFIIMHLKSDKPAEAQEAIKYFKWAFKNGDKLAEDLDYVPMPKSVLPRIEQEMNKIK